MAPQRHFGGGRRPRRHGTSPESPRARPRHTAAMAGTQHRPQGGGGQHRRGNGAACDGKVGGGAGNQGGTTATARGDARTQGGEDRQTRQSRGRSQGLAGGQWGQTQRGLNPRVLGRGIVRWLLRCRWASPSSPRSPVGTGLCVGQQRERWRLATCRRKSAKHPRAQGTCWGQTTSRLCRASAGHVAQLGVVPRAPAHPHDAPAPRMVLAPTSRPSPSQVSLPAPKVCRCCPTRPGDASPRRTAQPQSPSASFP